MSRTDSLGDRMKQFEEVFSHKTMARTPVIIRIDGKAFHTWTKQLKAQDSSLKDSPFSKVMHATMVGTTAYLVSNIQNAVFGYTQSDEISIVLNDWKELGTDQWFGSKIQKIASVSASMATAVFNDVIREFGDGSWEQATFDSRVFNLPKEEVVNYMIWRQQDATRNSVQMLGRFYYSHKEMHKKTVSDIQDMLMADHNKNWNDIENWMKRGSCVYRGGDGIVVSDYIPIFTQDREFIERFLQTN